MGIQPSGDSTDFRSLVDYLDGVAVWIVSQPGQFDYVSSGIEDIWGIPADDIEDDPSLVLQGVHPDDREQVRASMQRSPDELEEEEYEGRVGPTGRCGGCTPASSRSGTTTATWSTSSGSRPTSPSRSAARRSSRH